MSLLDISALHKRQRTYILNHCERKMADLHVMKYIKNSANSTSLFKGVFTTDSMAKSGQ